MPRPKLDPTQVLKLELRITPPDGQPISDWKVGTDFIQLIAAKEGGTDECRLHYHCYVETLRSRSWIVKWIYSIAHCYNGETGNSVFFSRKPHDNTIGYVVKHGDVVMRHGCEETYITEWLARSEQYCRSKQADRKRGQRIEKAFTHLVKQTIEARLKESPELRTPSQILLLIKDEYRNQSRVYPSRTQVENLIATCLDPYEPSLVDAFYLRSFESRF